MKIFSNSFTLREMYIKTAKKYTVFAYHTGRIPKAWTYFLDKPVEKSHSHKLLVGVWIGTNFVGDNSAVPVKIANGEHLWRFVLYLRMHATESLAHIQNKVYIQGISAILGINNR